VRRRSLIRARTRTDKHSVRVFAIPEKDSHFILLEAKVVFDRGIFQITSRCFDSLKSFGLSGVSSDLRKKFMFVVTRMFSSTFQPAKEHTLLPPADCVHQPPLSNDCVLYAASFFMHRIRSGDSFFDLKEKHKPFIFSRENVLGLFRATGRPGLSLIKK